MRIGDKAATIIFWIVTVLFVGLLIFTSFINLFDEFQPWLLVATVFALIAIALGVRQCWQSVRGFANGSEPDNSSTRTR